MKEKAIQLVTNALRELNEELQYEHLNNPTASTVIFGGEDGIDSLSLVTLVVAVEGETERVFGQKILLSDEKAMSQRNSPFRSVESLAEFMVRRFQEAGTAST